MYTFNVTDNREYTYHVVSIPVTLKVYNDSPQGWRGREKRGNFKRSVVRIQSLGSEISTLLSWFRRFYLTTKRCDSHYEIPYDPVVRTSDRDHYSKQGAALLEANMIRPDASHHAAPASPHPPSLRPPGAVKQKGGALEQGGGEAPGGARRGGANNHPAPSTYRPDGALGEP